MPRWDAVVLSTHNMCRPSLREQFVSHQFTGSSFATFLCHWSLCATVAFAEDRSAVKQAPHPSARLPDPLPDATGGLSGPQVSARGASGRLQQGRKEEAEAARAGLKEVAGAVF